MTISRIKIQEIINLKVQRYSIKEIVEMTGVSCSAIVRHLSLNGLTKKHKEHTEHKFKHSTGRVCKCCHKIFFIKKGRGCPPIYCSPDCKPKIIKQCQHCFICFEALNDNIKFCSQKCSAMSWGEKRKQKAIDAILDGTKTCTKCEKEKPLNQFTRVTKSADGYNSWCKSCNSERWKKYTSSKKVRNRLNEYYRERLQNQTPEEKRLSQDAYNERRNKRYQTDPNFKLHELVRTAVRETLKNGNKNGRHWEGLVGYTVNDLKIHIEKQFTSGMSWENCGEWHLDHIIPKSVFNFTKPEHEDFKRCWSLKNLQPLWATDNLSKGSKLEKPFQPRLAL